MRALIGLGSLAVMACLLIGSADAGPIYEVDYADWDVVVTDNKGVKTEAEDFGFWTGPNILVARRGSAKVEIPFRNVRLIEIGKYIPTKGHSPGSITTRKGRKYDIQVERYEGRRYLGGDTDFGTYRIQLHNIARLDLLRLSHTDDDRRP